MTNDNQAPLWEDGVGEAEVETVPESGTAVVGRQEAKRRLRRSTGSRW